MKFKNMIFLQFIVFFIGYNIFSPSISLGYQNSSKHLTKISIDGTKIFDRLGNGSIDEMIWSDDGSQLAVAGSTGIWLYTNNFTEKHFLEGHSQPVIDVIFHSSGNYLVSSGEDYTVKVWNLANNIEIYSFDLIEYGVAGLDFNSDGSIFATANLDGDIRLWDFESHQLLQTLEGHNANVNTVDFSSDDRYLVSGSGEYGYSGRHEVILWDIETANTNQKKQMRIKFKWAIV